MGICLEILNSAIVPILKNRQGDTSDKKNYCPIAIVTAISKSFELCLMNLIESHLITVLTMGFVREIKYLVSCILYLVFCIYHRNCIN